MIQINLVPDIKQELIRAQRGRAKVITLSIITSIVSIGAVTLLAVYIFGVQSVRGVLADGQIKDQFAKLQKDTDLEKNLTIQNQLSKITELNNSKKIHSRIFDVLKAIIPPDASRITFSDLVIDTSTKTLKMNGQAPLGYSQLEVFKKTIANAVVNYTKVGDKDIQKVDLASNIDTSNINYGLDSSGNKILRFTLSFDYPLELLSPESENVTINLIIDGNVTDSYLGVSKNIFADNPIVQKVNQ